MTLFFRVARMVFFTISHDYYTIFIRKRVSHVNSGKCCRIKGKKSFGENGMFPVSKIVIVSKAEFCSHQFAKGILSTSLPGYVHPGFINGKGDRYAISNEKNSDKATACKQSHKLLATCTTSPSLYKFTKPLHTCSIVGNRCVPLIDDINHKPSTPSNQMATTIAIWFLGNS